MSRKNDNNCIKHWTEFRYGLEIHVKMKFREKFVCLNWVKC